MTKKRVLGQYFTTNVELKEKFFEFIKNMPSVILEPSIGQGDLVAFITNKTPSVSFDMYEIDTKITLLDEIKKDADKIVYNDFMKESITKSYTTIVGNPPFVRTKRGNLYIDFTEKCFSLLEENGELIFIVPSDFFKLTSSAKLLNAMMLNGTFTHIFHPHNEKMFENASIDVILFRYCKNNLIEKKVLYNNELLYITNSNGLITFSKEENTSDVMFQNYFDIYVGLVTGKEDVYKNADLGNINIINGEDKVDKYIYLDKYPSENENVNNYLLKHKKRTD